VARSHITARTRNSTDWLAAHSAEIMMMMMMTVRRLSWLLLATFAGFINLPRPAAYRKDASRHPGNSVAVCTFGTAENARHENVAQGKMPKKCTK